MNRHVAKINFGHDPNLGLYGVATDKFCLVGRSLSEQSIKELEEVLKVPVIKVSVYGTNLIGVFVAANSKAILLPDVTYEDEYAHIKREMDKLGVKVFIIKSEHTALGNNIILNDKAAIISTNYSPQLFAEIKKALGIEVKQMDLAGTSLPGSVGFITNNGGVFNPNMSDKEIKAVEKTLGYEIGLSTVNMGNMFISSGIIGNSFGFVIGSMSSGYEITRVDESLGFLR